MNYTQQLIEALMDKGYPKMKAYDYLNLVNPFALFIIPLLDPRMYQTQESINRYYNNWFNKKEEESRKHLINVRYMKPVWDRYKNWEYELDS